MERQGLFPRVGASGNGTAPYWFMNIKRLDHISVVVEDMEHAVDFFTALGMTVVGEAQIEGDWVDRVNGLDDVRVDIVMLRTPDGHGQLELTKFRKPELEPLTPSAAQAADAARVLLPSISRKHSGEALLIAAERHLTIVADELARHLRTHAGNH